jgi:hypothetical protein
VLHIINRNKNLQKPGEIRPSAHEIRWYGA